MHNEEACSLYNKILTLLLAKDVQVIKIKVFLLFTVGNKNMCQRNHTSAHETVPLINSDKSDYF